MFSSIFLLIVRVFAESAPWFFKTILEFFLDVSLFWARKLYRLYNRKDPLREHLETLANVKSYRKWRKTAAEIDKITDMDLWRQNFISKHYDYILIDDRLKLLRESRMNRDAHTIMSLFRSGLIRNFGGITLKNLYTKSYLGTKHKIEDYVEEVLACLYFLDESISVPSEKDNHEYVMYSRQLKLDFLHDARQSFGSTALLLHGGSLFGLCHLGVVRALYFRKMLPKIIAGSAVGAAVASLVCTVLDGELYPILYSIVDAMGDIDKLNHEVDENYGNVVENVVKKGYSQDILIFLKFVRDTIGDITFEEAYLKTEKVLNIVVHPTPQLVPLLLNYITAPNVIIWTAIYASTGSGVLSDNVKLYVKDYHNQIVPMLDSDRVTFLKPQDVSYQGQYFHSGKNFNNYEENDGTNKQNKKFKRYFPSVKENSPYVKLTELFNVNNFITSLARPYLAPFITNDCKHQHYYYLGPRYKRDIRGRKSILHSKDTSLNEKSGNTNLSLKEYISQPRFNFSKTIKNILAIETQHRLEVMNKLGLLPDLIKRFCIDEKPSSIQTSVNSREVVIVPELRYLVRDFGRLLDVHKTMENIPYWVLVGERSVWPLLPMLWVSCAIEIVLDELYNSHRKS